MQVSEHLITAPEYNKFYDVVIDASAEQIHGAFQLEGKGGQVPVIETYNRAEKGECGLKCPINYCVGGFFSPSRCVVDACNGGGWNGTLTLDIKDEA